MNTTKVFDLVPGLGPSAQARICKLILQEVLASITEDGPCELWLEDLSENKIGAIKAVRAITGLGLQEAKGVVDAAAVAPKLVRKFDSKVEAAAAGKEFEAAGARYSIREVK